MCACYEFNLSFADIQLHERAPGDRAPGVVLGEISSSDFAPNRSPGLQRTADRCRNIFEVFGPLSGLKQRSEVASAF